MALERAQDVIYIADWWISPELVQQPTTAQSQTLTFKSFSDDHPHIHMKTDSTRYYNDVLRLVSRFMS